MSFMKLRKIIKKLKSHLFYKEHGFFNINLWKKWKCIFLYFISFYFNCFLPLEYVVKPPLKWMNRYMGQSIQEWTSKISGRQPLKRLKWYGLLKLKLFENCLPQILLGSFLNTVSPYIAQLRQQQFFSHEPNPSLKDL